MHTPGPWYSVSRSVWSKGGRWIAEVNLDEDRPLIAAAPDLYAALEAVEWITTCDDVDFIEVCPWCGRKQYRGHAPDCLRQAALRKGRGNGE